MRIDNRKVNGRVTIDPDDVVDVFTILLVGGEAKWIASINPDAPLIYFSDAAVADKLKAALSTMQALRFSVIHVTLPGGSVYPERAYTVALDRASITIDVDDIMTGKKLKITVLTGAIELVDNK